MPWIIWNVIHGRNVKQGSKSEKLRFKTMMSAGVLLCLCPNEIVAMTIAFEMKPMMICSDVRTTRAYFSVGTDINDLLVLLILNNGWTRQSDTVVKSDAVIKENIKESLLYNTNATSILIG